MSFIRKLKIEYFFIALFTLLFCIVFSNKFFNSKFLHPISAPLEDVRFSDLYYSEIKCNTNKVLTQSPIVLLNVDTLSRQQMVGVLQLLAKTKPAVVAMDVIFSKFYETATDTALREALRHCPNLIMCYSDSSENYPDGKRTHPFFGNYSTGFDNFIGTDYRYSTIRDFYPYVNNSPAFAIRVARQYETFLKNKYGTDTFDIIKSLHKFLGNHQHEPLEINYSGNCRHFTTYHPHNYFDTSFNAPALLNDKIVIIGAVAYTNGPYSRKIGEDMFFTPLNPRLTGRSYPDMHGTEIHANIIQMILNKNDYVFHAPKPVQWAVGFFFCMIMVYPFTWLYQKHYKIFHVTAKVIELIAASLWLLIAMLLLRINIKIELEPALFCIFMSALSIYFYDGLVKGCNWLFAKLQLSFRVKSMFTETHH